MSGCYIIKRNQSWMEHLYFTYFSYSLQGIWQPGICLRAGKFSASAIYILKSIWQTGWNILIHFNGGNSIRNDYTWPRMQVQENKKCSMLKWLKRTWLLFWVDLVDTPRDWNPGCPWKRLRKQTLKFSPHYVQTQPKFLYCIINICSFSWHIGIPDGLCTDSVK